MMGKKLLHKKIYIIDFNSIDRHCNWLSDNRVSKHDYRINPAKILELDFSRSRFLKPYHIAPLACLIHEYKAKGFAVKLSHIPDSIEAYLKSFNFDQFCKGLDTKAFELPTDKKTFSLWHIEESRKESYSLEVQKYFENNLFAGQNLFVLGNSLSELMNNVFDHSRSKIAGYTFTQLNTRSNTIVTCVCDFGIGIPMAVNSFLKNSGQKPLPNDLALRKALEFNFSTLTKPHNRGFGWDTIISNLQLLGGKLLIVSNNALYLMRHDGIVRTSLNHSNFHGTLVVITLDTRNFTEKEIEINEEMTLL